MPVIHEESIKVPGETKAPDYADGSQLAACGLRPTASGFRAVSRWPSSPPALVLVGYSFLRPRSSILNLLLSILSPRSSILSSDILGQVERPCSHACRFDFARCGHILYKRTGLSFPRRRFSSALLSLRLRSGQALRLRSDGSQLTAYSLRRSDSEPSAVSRKPMADAGCRGHRAKDKGRSTKDEAMGKEKGEMAKSGHSSFPLCSCPLSLPPCPSSRGVLTLGFEKRDQGTRGSRDQVPAVGHSIPLSLYPSIPHLFDLRVRRALCNR